MKKYIENINNTKITYIKSNKYKTNIIKVVYKGEYTRENCTYRSLLSYMLKMGTEKLKSKKDLVLQSYKMYNAIFDVSVNIYYKTCFTTFTIDYIKGSLLGEDYTCDIIDFLKEIIQKPNIQNSRFDQKSFDECKRMLKQDILNRYDNKEVYAIDQTIKIMGKGTIMEVNPHGEINDLEKITSKMLYSFYLKMLKKEEISIFMIGEDSFKTAKEIVFKLNIFNYKRGKITTLLEKEDEVIKNEVNNRVEIQKISQSIIVKGYKINQIAPSKKLYYGSIVFSSMFGSSSFSKLFSIIREKKSLVYNIDSTIIFTYQAMVVFAGLNTEKFDEVNNLIEKEIENFRKKRITKALLQKAKMSIIRSLKSFEDTPSALLNYLVGQDLTYQNLTVNETVKKIREVNMDNIVEIANNVVLDTVFFLRGEQK